MTSSPPSLPYHEKQSFFNQLCLMHALNMIAGSSRFTKQRMDEACQKLCPTNGWYQKNPHSGWFGGNYDVNIAMYIVENELNCNIQYFDGRKNPKEIFQDSTRNIHCLLLNVPSFVPLPGRHWICYKLVDHLHWFRLNSHESRPVLIADIVEEMRKHLERGNTILTISKEQ